MGMRGVVPDIWQGRRRPVEDDAAADEDDSLDEALDGTELVRDVEDRHPELAPEPLQERGNGVLRLDVDPGCRFVEHEQLRLGGEGFRDEGALLLAAGERRQPPIGLWR